MRARLEFNGGAKESGQLRLMQGSNGKYWWMFNGNNTETRIWSIDFSKQDLALADFARYGTIEEE